MDVLQRANVANMERRQGVPERDGFRAVDSPEDEISLSPWGAPGGRASFQGSGSSQRLRVGENLL